MLAIIQRKPFEAVKRCPAKQVETKLNKFLWCLFQERRITEPLYNQLHASECPLPRLYGLVKIHKQDAPLCPVISAIGSGLYPASKYLAQVLKPLVGNTVAKKKKFVNVLADVRVSKDKELVSFDVKSLYTSLPAEWALVLVERKLKDDDMLPCRTPPAAEEIVELLRI